MTEAVIARLFQSEPDDAVNRAVLDAASRTFEREGIRHATMRETARAAGLARATVYRRYPDKAALVSAVVLRESRRFLEWVDSRVERFTDPAEQTIECFVVVTTGLRDHPLLNQLLTTQDPDVLPALTADAGTILAVARTYLTAKLRDHQRAGRLSEFDPEPAAEVFVRLVHSLTLLRAGRIPGGDEERTREFARRHLVPIIVS